MKTGISIPIVLCCLSFAVADTADYVACRHIDEDQGSTIYDVSANGFFKKNRDAEWIINARRDALKFDRLNDYVEITDGDGYPDQIDSPAGELTN